MSFTYIVEIPIIADQTWNGYAYVHSWPPSSPRTALLEDMKGWCRVNVGDKNWFFSELYRKSACQFRFKNSEDCLAFKIRYLS